MGFNPLDVVFGVILVLLTIGGLLRGFVRVAIGLAGLAVSLALALRLADQGPTWFANVMATPELARVAAFIAVFAVGLLATAVASWLAWKLVRAAQIGWVDRLIGGSVGLLGGALLCAGLLVALTTFLPPASPVLRESRLMPVAILVTDLAATVLPPEMADTYRERREALEPWLGGSHEHPPAAEQLRS
ncbi:MAG: CvpA family protein [Acidobacteriota bacterium]|nr:MAG: CvpA family protein [Acidobacteriota bacterium]